MTQDRLDGLLTISVEQELTYNIHIEDVIDIFKSYSYVHKDGVVNSFVNKTYIYIYINCNLSYNNCFTVIII